MMQLDHLLCLTTTWPQFSLIDESPGQKGLDKQDAVFIVKNAGLSRIGGLEFGKMQGQASCKEQSPPSYMDIQ